MKNIHFVNKLIVFSVTIKVADYIIDIGPEGGANGGQVLFQGTPEQLIKEKKSYTGEFLKKEMN